MVSELKVVPFSIFAIYVYTDASGKEVAVGEESRKFRELDVMTRMGQPNWQHLPVNQ